MEFVYYGAGSLLITTKQIRVLIDPPSASSKIKSPSKPAEVILATVQSNGGFEHKNGFKIDSPGEYEIKGVGIQAIAAQLHIDKPDDPWKGVMYVIEHAGVRALFTGNIAPQLNDQQIENIGEVNVLVLPVGGHGLTLDANAASSLVSRFEPNFVIPVHYDDGKSKYAMPQEPVSNFLKELGSEDAQEETKLKVSAKHLEEGTKVVVLKPQG